MPVEIRHYFGATVQYSGAAYPFIDYYKTVLRYYRELLSDPGKFQAFSMRIHEVARLIAARIPNVTAVFGVGHPFYGNVPCGARIIHSLRSINRGVMHVDEVAQRLLPDIDLLIVFRSDEGPHQLTPHLYDDCKEALVQSNYMYRRAWDEVTAVLHREYGIARSSEEPIDAFMQEGRLHVDLLPIPEHIWKELPVLLGWEHNLPYLTLTRDLSFTCRPIVPGSQGEIPLRHRINQVLYHIKRIGKSTPELLIVYLIEQHPYSYLAKMFRETNMHLIRLWQATITAAEISGLLARTGDGYLQITAQGERQLENALQRKGEIIRNGFDY